MMIKYRVHDVAKDLNIPNKEVIDTIQKYCGETKKHMTALTEQELDCVFESFTQSRQVESFDEYFAQNTSAEQEPAQENSPEQAAAAPAQGEEKSSRNEEERPMRNQANKENGKAAGDRRQQQGRGQNRQGGSLCKSHGCVLLILFKKGPRRYRPGPQAALRFNPRSPQSRWCRALPARPPRSPGIPR